ncbi:MAG: hypothetical protein Q4D98_11160 [Planctomycetia bacterium]|nr:hypothetical protein [Planctomycetia bacterium]
MSSFTHFVFLAGLWGMLTLNLAAQTLPNTWMQEWNTPSAQNRPLQIIHGSYYRGKPTPEEGMETLVERGLGGVVINVPFSDQYLQNEDEWKRFVHAVRAADEKGLRYWIYDEKGYPSLAAGGLVLKEDPKREAKELVYDAKTGEFTVRPCFEYTHASNNYDGIQRYPSLVNPEAGAAFIRLTHDAYYQHLPKELFSKVEAFFTDEPSTNALGMGPMSEAMRKRVKVYDPVDLTKPNLPMVVWEDDFPEIYKKRYGGDLNAVRKSLFTGDTDADKAVRQNFWQMVACRCCEAYYTPIRDWCRAHGTLASGHTLAEEGLLLHIPLDGDKLEVLKKFDLPGLDFLSSVPEKAMDRGWQAVLFPVSAMVLNGGRRVMCEISDHDFRIAEKGPAPVAFMQASAAWQQAAGVTEFTLYYNPGDRTVAEYRAYCEHVGRVNALLRDAKPVYTTVMYYPIRQCQAEFFPSARRSWESQSNALQTMSNSYADLGKRLVKNQTPFFMVGDADLERVLSGESAAGKIMEFVVPQGVTFSPEQEKILAAFEAAGGRVLRGEVRPTPVLEPACDMVFYGKFVREGWTFHMLVNLTDKPYSGKCLAVPASGALELNPLDGSVVPAKTIVEIPGYQTRILAVPGK